MVKLLAVSASPVDGASTDIILNLLLTALRERVCEKLPVSMSFVKLNELKFIACQSCGEAPREGFCLYQDDLSPVYDALATCDCLLIGTPVYFDSVSAQAKMFIDRCNCFRPADFDALDPDHAFRRVLTRKRPGAMVLVGGERGWFEGARRVLAGFFKWVEVVSEGVVIFHSRDFRTKGTAASEPQVTKEVRRLADRLAAQLIESHG